MRRDVIHGVTANLGVLLRRRLFLFLSAGLICFLSLGWTFRAHNQRIKLYTPYVSPSDRLKGQTQHSFDTIEIDLHLLIPASEPNAELCKGLLSASILGYPTPTLINWRKKFTAGHLRANGSHIRKITGVLDYLDGFASEKHDQLVCMVDGYDLWFQLPPSVLHSRFRSVGRSLYNRTVEKLGEKTIEAEQISQSIIFGAQKNCGPSKAQADEVACYGQPESPLREDLYGPDTDVRDATTHLPLHMRPSFVNSGLVVGSIGAMKALMERAKQKAEAGEDHQGSDQYIFNEIFGEQEYWREVMRQRHRPWHLKAGDMLKSVLGMSDTLITDAHPSHKPANVTDDAGPYEFGIGLDYALELTQAAVLSEFDGRFLVYGDHATTQETLSGKGMPSPPRVSDLPADILEDKSGVEWAQIPLYTNVYTASIPITIHLNGMKNMRQGIWDQVWFFSSAKEHVREKGEVIAKDPQGNVFSWAELCQPFEAEVFDPKGLGMT